MLLPYEVEIMEESGAKSCVVVMAKGLGVEQIIWYNIEPHLTQASVVVLINFTDYEVGYYQGRSSVFFHNLKAMTIDQRRAVYAKGGVFAVSSRTFVTDLLNDVVEREKITCFLVNHLESLRENCTEAFIVHLLRKRNKSAVVKGFTESPSVLSYGITFLEEIMFLLKVDTLLLYPRFQETVKSSLAKDIDATQMKFKLSKQFKEIQVMLVDITSSLSNEIRRVERVDVDYETALAPSFSRVLRMGEYRMKTRRLDCDLKNIRRLVNLLYSIDFALFCDYYKILFSEQLELQKDATWISLDSAHALMEKIGAIRAAEDANNCTNVSEHDVLLEKEGIETQVVLGADLAPSSQDNTTLDGSVRRKVTQMYVESDGLSDESETDAVFDEEVVRKRRKLTGSRLKGPKLNALGQVLVANKEKRVCVLSGCEEISVAIQYFARDNGIEPSVFTSITHQMFRFVESCFDVVVLMDPSMASIRKIEVDSNRNDKQIETVVMYFADSLEEQGNLFDIRAEKDAFEKLIRRKSGLALNLSKEYDDEIFDEGKKILIDVREMRSSLPFAIYKSKSEIKVCTLSIGDYILSSTMCVERKGVYDFISSVYSGRMYSQLKMMESKYKYPILLLEFERNRRPCLSDHIDLTRDDFRHSVLSKFMLMLLNFARLRVVWSNSDTLTLKIFRSLQERESDSVESVSTGELDNTDTPTIDPVIYGILLGVDGITSFNYKKATANFKNLLDLAGADLQRLRNVFGDENGKKISQFFTKNIDTDARFNRTHP